MTKIHSYNKYALYSFLLHLFILTVLIFNFERSQPQAVIKHSDNPDKVITAMVLDETPSKMVQKQIPLPEASKKSVKPLAAPVLKEKIVPTKKEVLAIPTTRQKKMENKIQEQLLADLAKEKQKNKHTEQKKLQVDFEKEMREVKAKALQQQMINEQKKLAHIRSAQMAGVVDKYKALILQTISQHWLIPPSANKKLSAYLLIRLAPGGSVLDVQLTKSSGDEALDRSARAAVLKASPLPVPTAQEEFEPFRQFVLKVKPENVLNDMNV